MNEKLAIPSGFEKVVYISGGGIIILVLDLTRLVATVDILFVRHFAHTNITSIAQEDLLLQPACRICHGLILESVKGQFSVSC